MKKPEMFDSVALIQDLPEAGLVRGNMVIVESYHDGEGLHEVEFVDTDGNVRPASFAARAVHCAS